MADCKPISMPLDQNLKLRADEGQVLEDVTMYGQLDLLDYLATRLELHNWVGEPIYAAT